MGELQAPDCNDKIAKYFLSDITLTKILFAYSAQCSVLPPVHQHGNHLDTDFQDRDQAADGSQRKPPHLRRPGRVLQQCCQQDAQQLMCNRENEINQTKRYKCHQHTGQAEFLRKTQLQIVDIEILRQIMAMRKNISVETGKVCVGV